MAILQHEFFAIIVALLSSHHTAFGCGGLFCENARPVVQRGEAIVFGVQGNTVQMHIQILYEGPADAFSWVLPLPFKPGAIDAGSDVLFNAIFRQTLPAFQLEILDNQASDTCSLEAYQVAPCPPRGSNETSFADGAHQEGGAIVLEEGSVGPFDYVILEAAENDPSSVLRWLNDNDYDQPEGTGPLLNYYAIHDHVFVALRLQKDTESGEIVPLIVTYDMPEAESPEAASRRAMACVPIQLTSVAATADMPIQVYILGESRAVPLNFIDLQLDDLQVDWLGCQNNPRCYDDDYRRRFDIAAKQLVNHSFVTEFAGPSNVMAETIAIPVTTEDILAQATRNGFRQNIQPLLPDLPLVDKIVDDYGRTEYQVEALAKELEEKVLQPAVQAQAFVDRFSYLTRLYARLSPESMTKDPFFSFQPDLPSVDNAHRATAIPVCNAQNQPSALNITTNNNKGSSVTVPASINCFGQWVPQRGPAATATIANGLEASPALQLVSWGFPGDTPIIVLRDDNGTFDSAAVEEAIGFGDALVMNQTIPEYTASYEATTIFESDLGGSGSSAMIRTIGKNTAFWAVGATLYLLF